MRKLSVLIVGIMSNKAVTFVIKTLVLFSLVTLTYFAIIDPSLLRNGQQSTTKDIISEMDKQIDEYHRCLECLSSGDESYDQRLLGKSMTIDEVTVEMSNDISKIGSRQYREMKYRESELMLIKRTLEIADSDNTFMRYYNFIIGFMSSLIISFIFNRS